MFLAAVESKLGQEPVAGQSNDSTQLWLGELTSLPDLQKHGLPPK